MDNLLLVDGSSLLNSQYFGNLPNSVKEAKDLRKKAKTQEEKELAKETLNKAYEDILHTKNGIYTNAVYGFMKYLISAIKVMNPSYLVVTWDVTRNTFRRDIMPEYKGNRSDVDDPLKQQFKTCQELLKKIGITQYFSDTYESDDFCGSLVKKFEKDVKINILTKDHDFFQLVSDNTNVLLLCATLKISKNLNLKYSIDEKTIPLKTFLVNKETLLKEYDLTPNSVTFVKGIAGDTADNIPGIPNIGDVTAKILAKKYNSIKSLYEELKDKTEEELEELLKTWKTDGIKRSPLKYLLAENVFENKGKSLSAKEVGLLSETLATIKTDIEMNNSLEDLKLNYDKALILTSLKEYEIVSINL